MIKKITLLAMAIAAMAFAVPAMASAEIYDVKTEEPASSTTEISVSGSVGFATALGGFSGCVIHGVLTVESATTGTVHPEITPGTCKGNGKLADCTVLSAETESWDVHISSTDLTITNVFIDGTNNAACGDLIGAPGALENIDLSFSEITLTPTSGTSLDNMSVSGSGIAIIGGSTESAATASGSIGAEAETWGLQ